MLPYIHIFGRPLATYDIAITVAWLLCGLLIVRRCRRLGVSENRAALLVTVLVLCGLAGAKLFYLFIALLRDPARFATMSFGDYFGGGLVYYGGFFGGFAGLWLFSFIRKLPAKNNGGTFTYMRKILREYGFIIVYLPLAHAIGRVGCFLTGCCFGVENHTFGIAYHNPVPGVPVGIPLVPVQLFEAILNIVLFAILLSLHKKGRRWPTLTATYVYSYATYRFLLEYLRFDSARGVWAGLSTSQWVSVGLVAGMFFAQVTYKRAKTR